ncbi:MAG: hypothetical protein QOF14_2814 [Hyphomicrobiales bacterium]|jgi:hypothetical protein|nr:hypothetical protein [Hyphomicrobiales bacterium]
MSNNSINIEFGQWFKATATGDLAVIALVCIILAWFAIRLFKHRRDADSAVKSDERQ